LVAVCEQRQSPGSGPPWWCGQVAEKRVGGMDCRRMPPSAKGGAAM